MRLLADECVSGSTVAALRDAGADIAWITEIMPGADDRAVLDHAFREERILLTEDKDFGELTVRLGYPCRGILLLALSDLAASERASRAVEALRALGESTEGHFIVVEAGRVRRRPLPTPSNDAR